MAMGQAAATAAAIAVQSSVNVRDISIEKLKEILDHQGAIIPGKEKRFE